MVATYAELHCKSFYSFGLGASHPHELLAQAQKHGYSSLALTDTNLCGALEFARLANTLGVQPITGGEITLSDGSSLTLLARTRMGYSNISRLFTYANEVDRKEPRLDPVRLQGRLEGVTLIAGGRDGHLSKLALDGHYQAAQKLLEGYLEYTDSDSVYIELQQNLIHGDTKRNRALVGLAREIGIPIVATNDVHYHAPERYRLQNALVAAKHNTTIDQALLFVRPNRHFYLKSQAQMEKLFRQCPEAISNTLKIAKECTFDLSTDLGYQLPEPDVPDGYTPESYLRQLCYEGAVRRYGSVSKAVEDRLEEEFRLFRKLNLSGFLLLYRQIGLIAQDIAKEQGLIPPETPLEERSPIRSRGSSVALLVGYLIGISHIDPLKWDLTLERFISEHTDILPDIDLDFPRGLRDEVIKRVHDHFGPEYAVLTGAITTYRVKGVIQDLGKALGLPPKERTLLSKKIQSHDSKMLRKEMLELPDFRDKVDAPGWRDIIELTPQLVTAPRLLSQHVGGMILSSSPIPEMVPIRAGAIDGRFIMDWNRDSVADANFAKIDLLSLPVLDQINEALDLIEERHDARPDLGQISPNDPNVYDMINAGKSKGVFLLQSPAQLKMGQRLRSRNLLDLAYQVALIRPGVGVQGSAVSQFIERYRHGAEWAYDHPLEERALKRGYGIIVWQEQVVQLIMDVAGLSAAEADEIRRAFTKSSNEHLIEMWRGKFREGALKKGVSEEVAEKIFGKINGHYMFPESHSHAFAITAYQAVWLKHYYPLEFFVALMNNQPMGFYPVETLKQDARKFGVPFLNPCVNRSHTKCAPEGNSILMGLQLIKDVGKKNAELITEERARHGPYINAGDLVRRTGLKPQAVLSLVLAGALDAVTPNRRLALWEAGLYERPTKSGQMVLPLSMDNNVPDIEDINDYDKMLDEYETMGIYPKGHMMEFVRPRLSPQVLKTVDVETLAEGDQIMVAGWPIARQHPKGQEGIVFVTVEDEVGDTQLIIWPKVFERCRKALRSHVILARGVISKWDGTVNVVVSDIKAVDVRANMPRSHDWH